MVNWGTLHIGALLLSLTIQYGLYTTQVDLRRHLYKHPLSDPCTSIYLQDSRKLCSTRAKSFICSLYDHHYAAKLFYDFLHCILVKKLNFCISPHDHCLFIRHDCLIVTWTDDVILITKEKGVVGGIIEATQMHDLDSDKQNEQRGPCGEPRNSIFASYQIGQLMTQTGLLKQVIKSLSLENANGKMTPMTKVLAWYKDHEAFKAQYNYHSVVGMILYLANTTQPDISFTICQ